jgi:hypothetical protein
VIRKLLILSLLCSATLVAQEVYSSRIKGLRVYGSAEAGLPIAELRSRPITIEFDVNETTPPDFRIRVYHCDRDWNVTATSFVNDEMRNWTKASLRFEPAPAGVQEYRFHYSVKLPGFPGIEQFPQSGNYIFELYEEGGHDVLARGRFFVVEKVLAPAMVVSNRSLPSEVNPYNQVNKIAVRFVVPKADTLTGGEVLYPINLTCADVYRNRQLHDPWRIDANDQNPNTFVDGYGTMKMTFIVDNVTPGNGYRRLDLRDIDQYPLGQQLRARLGADVSRFLHPPARDNYGASVLTSGNRYADYLPFQFELLLDGHPYDSVFVVGDFNGWEPSAECTMKYDDGSGRYLWLTWLRRGVYDYQYVVGSNDWMAVEGNDWRTVNVYTVFIYYRDNRYGGFDRIIGYSQRLSPGGNQPTSD